MVEKYKKDNILILVFILIIVFIVAYGLYWLGTPRWIHDPPISGELTYLSEISDPTDGNAVFTLNLTTPDNPNIEDVRVHLIDFHGNINESYEYEWEHINSDSTHIMGGDRLNIQTVFDLSGYEIVVSIPGYSGILSASISPP